MGVGFMIVATYVFNTKSATGKYVESGSPTKGQSSEFGNQKGLWCTIYVGIRMLNPKEEQIKH